MACVTWYLDARHGIALFEGNKVQELHQFIPRFLSRSVEINFLFKDRVSIVVSHFLLAFKVCQLVAMLYNSLWSVSTYNLNPAAPQVYQALLPGLGYFHPVAKAWFC